MAISPVDLRFFPAVRWEILRTCRFGGNVGVTEDMIREVVVSSYLGADRKFVRDQLDYLEKRELIEIERSEIDPWRVWLARYGYDMVEYRIDCKPGIRRPPRVDWGEG